MSDYGFATYDERNSRKVGEINSKWPIFGPLYNDIKNSYKTYHFSDTTTSDPADVDLGISAPSNGETNSAYHYEQIEIFRRKHGYKKRPVGYAFFTGNIVKNTRGYINQYHQNGSPAYGGDFTVTGVNSATIPVKSSIQGEMKTAYTSTGYSPLANTLEDSKFTIYDGSSYFPDGDLKVPTDVISRVKTTYTMYNGNDPEDLPMPGGGYCLPPYELKIDDEYIVVYKNVYSCDVWYMLDSGSTRVYDRVKGITDFAGSEVDMTVIFCPYTMEDLL